MRTGSLYSEPSHHRYSTLVCDTVCTLHAPDKARLGDTSKLKINVIMTLGGGGGQGRDANFSMNFEPSFLIVGLELASTRSYKMSVQTTLTCISANVLKSRYDYYQLLLP